MNSETYCVAARGINHHYGQDEHAKQVLFDNHLNLSPGEIVILTGPSGSGKTTLLTLVGALRTVQEGSLQVLGQEMKDLSAAGLVAARRRVGFIFQAHNLFAALTARENVRFASEQSEVAAVEQMRRGEALLRRLGLGERMDYKPQALSGGQRQRVAIARALVNHPRLILADEPTAALDKDAGREVIELLREHAARDQATVLMVTHDPRVLDVADRIVHMVDGRIVSDVNVHVALRVAELLRRCVLFKDLNSQVLSEVSAKMKIERFQPGAVVFRKGDAGDRFYIIDIGAVEVRDAPGAEGVITLGPGDFFGEVALLSAEPRNATLVARSLTSCFTLDAEGFRMAREIGGTFAEQLRRFYTQRI